MIPSFFPNTDKYYLYMIMSKQSSLKNKTKKPVTVTFLKDINTMAQNCSLASFLRTPKDKTCKYELTSANQHPEQKLPYLCSLIVEDKPQRETKSYCKGMFSSWNLENSSCDEHGNSIYITRPCTNKQQYRNDVRKHVRCTEKQCCIICMI